MVPSPAAECPASQVPRCLRALPQSVAKWVIVTAPDAVYMYMYMYMHRHVLL